MKTKIIKTFLLIIVILFSFAVSAQIISFEYDDAGNRILRDVIYLQPQTLTDTTNANYATEHLSILDNTKITISPNPSPGRFKVLLEGFDLETPKLFLHSINGNMIYKNQDAGALTEIDISKRPNGTYILTLIIGDEKKVWKIIKQ